MTVAPDASATGSRGRGRSHARQRSGLSAETKRVAFENFRLGLAILGSIALYATALFYTYKLKISPSYSYGGLTFRDPEPAAYATAIVLVAGLGWFMPRRLRRVSDFMLWVIFVQTIAPSILLAQYTQTLSIPRATLMGFVVAACFLGVIAGVRSAPRGRLPLKRFETASAFWLLLAGFAIFMYAYLIGTTGLNLRLLSFTDVYSARSDFGEAAAGSAVVGYLLGLLTNVVNPLFVARGIYSGRAIFVMEGVGGQLLLYATAGNRSHFFSAVALIAVSCLFRWRPRPPGLAILVAATAASALALLLDRILGGVTWTSLISRRAVIVPGALTAAYLAVFENRPRQLFAEVIPIVDNPYTAVPPPNIVGAVFVGDPGTSANVNFLGHGYLNGGFIGMAVESFVVLVLLVAANYATRGLPLAVACLALFAPTMSITSSNIFTVILTHGLLGALVLCAIAPSRGWGRRGPRRATNPPRSRGASPPALTKTTPSSVNVRPTKERPHASR